MTKSRKMWHTVGEYTEPSHVGQREAFSKAMHINDFPLPLSVSLTHTNTHT